MALTSLRHFPRIAWRQHGSLPAWVGLRSGVKSPSWRSPWTAGDQQLSHRTPCDRCEDVASGSFRHRESPPLVVQPLSGCAQTQQCSVAFHAHTCFRQRTLIYRCLGPQTQWEHQCRRSVSWGPAARKRDLLVPPWVLVWWLLRTPREQFPVSAAPPSPWALQRKAQGHSGPGPGGQPQGNQSDPGTGAVQVQGIGESQPNFQWARKCYFYRSTFMLLFFLLNTILIWFCIWMELSHNISR